MILIIYIDIYIYVCSVCIHEFYIILYVFIQYIIFYEMKVGTCRSQSDYYLINRLGG